MLPARSDLNGQRLNFDAEVSYTLFVFWFDGI